jgi:hypothetical protein
MKLLLTMMLCMFAVFANSQTTKEQLSQKQADEIMKNYRRNIQPKVVLTDSLINRFNKSYLVNKRKPGVYRLKGGMPCIVPDTKDIVAIPNAWKGSVKTSYKGKPPVIPNPAQPNILPDIK